MKTKKSVLLTGAAGTVGREVLKQLSASENLNVSIFDIRTQKSKKIFSEFSHNIEIIYGDITNKHDLKPACINKDVVIHLAAIIPPLADDKPELANKVNVTGTDNLIKLLEEFSPDSFLLYSSSVSIYGDRLENPYIRVSDPLKPSKGDEYAKTKIAAEKLIQESKLDWAIFRLCAIMGGHEITKLMFHQPLKTSLEIATPSDTAGAFVNAIEKRDELKGKIYNLGGGERCRSSYEEFLKRSFNIAGLGKLNFAEKSFADKNFHCGFYEDGNELENILHFQKDTLDDHFKDQEKKTSTIRKIVTSLFRWPIKYYLQKLSEPLKAYKLKDEKAIKHYFENEESNNG